MPLQWCSCYRLWGLWTLLITGSDYRKNFCLYAEDLQISSLKCFFQVLTLHNHWIIQKTGWRLWGWCYLTTLGDFKYLTWVQAGGPRLGAYVSRRMKKRGQSSWQGVGNKEHLCEIPTPNIISLGSMHFINHLVVLAFLTWCLSCISFFFGMYHQYSLLSVTYHQLFFTSCFAMPSTKSTTRSISLSRKHWHFSSLVSVQKSAQHNSTLTKKCCKDWLLLMLILSWPRNLYQRVPTKALPHLISKKIAIFFR